jgi:hypothetical protein
VRIRRVVPVVIGLILAAGTVVLGAPAASATPFVPIAATPLPSGFKAIEVDAATQRVFVSSPTSSVVTVLTIDGQVIGTLNVPGAGALLLDGRTLYVAATTVGRIDAFDTATLAPVGTFGGGTLIRPGNLVKAGGRLWTTTGNCGSDVRLASVNVATGVTTVHPSITSLSYCPFLFTSPVDPNLILGFDVGLSPTTVVRLDVSTGAPMVTATLRTDNSNSRDGKVLPDGKTFALASGAPYEIRTFGVDPLQPNGVIYPTSNYPNAVEATAAAGGLLAAGRDSAYDVDIDVFRLGDPSVSLLRYDFGSTANTLKDAGLAFSPDGARLFAVSGNWSGDTATLNVFGPSDPGGRYTSLTPARILDTRTGTGGISGRLGSGATVDVQVTGLGGIPATGVSAVAMNVTVTQPTATSYLTLYPAGGIRPLASNLNFTPGETVPNLVVVKVGAGGRVSMFNAAGATDVIFDVAGWFSDAAAGAGAGTSGRYGALQPARILDTRDGTGGGVRLGPGASLDVQIAGRGGVPATGAAAAVLNVAATGTTAPSYITVHPTGEARPLAANLNFLAGETVSNRAMVKLGAGGKVTIFNAAGSADVVVDVNGWYGDESATTATGRYTALPPARIMDTRDDTSGVTGPLHGGSDAALQVTGRGGVPATGVSAVILNVTAVDPAGPGYLTLKPSGAARPLVSDLNYAAGETRPNLAVVRLSADGKIDLFTSTTTQVVVDVAGWMS